MYSIIRNKLISLDANEGEIVALSEADAKASSVIEGSYNLEPISTSQSILAEQFLLYTFHARYVRRTQN